jgi:hypothetical protein
VELKVAESIIKHITVYIAVKKTTVVEQNLINFAITHVKENTNGNR